MPSLGPLGLSISLLIQLLCGTERADEEKKEEQGEKRKRGAGFPLRRTGPKLSLTSSSKRVQKDKKWREELAFIFFLYYHHNILGGRELAGKTSHSVEP